jgi:Mitochondrial sulfhydryl oxidase involved in the biogenesis of cytosolic Fe/S proteins
MQCPLNKQEIGNNTWHLLHSIAAHYPEAPSAKEKDYYKEFFLLFHSCTLADPVPKTFRSLQKLIRLSWTLELLLVSGFVNCII